MATNAITGLTDEQERQRQLLAKQRSDMVIGGAGRIAKDLFDPTDPFTYLGAFGKVGRGMFAATAGMRPTEADAMLVGTDDVAKMARATGMKNSNASPGRIFQETGLVQVPTKDGFTWAEQISDAGAKINPDVLERVQTGITKSITRGKQTPVENITLDALLEHPELYKRYPELAKTTIEEVNGFQLMAGTQGFYDEAAKVMGIKKLNPYMMKPEQVQEQLTELTQTLLHESQHAIQGLEQWPRGGNTGQFTTAGQKKAQKVVNDADAALAKATDAFFVSKNIKPPYSSAALIQDVVKFRNNGPDAIKYLSPERQETIRQASSIPELDQFIRAKARIDQTAKKIDQRNKVSFKKYQALAGETQARTAEKMFEEAQKTPDVYSRYPATSFYDVDINDLIFRDPFAPTIK
jgi:hypothetical protein